MTSSLSMLLSASYSKVMLADQAIGVVYCAPSDVVSLAFDHISDFEHFATAQQEKDHLAHFCALLVDKEERYTMFVAFAEETKALLSDAFGVTFGKSVAKLPRVLTQQEFLRTLEEVL